MGLAREFPELLAALVCMASDEYDEAMVAKGPKVPAHCDPRSVGGDLQFDVRQ